MQLFGDSEDDGEDLADNFIVNLCKRFIPATCTFLFQYLILSIRTCFVSCQPALGIFLSEFLFILPCSQSLDFSAFFSNLGAHF